MPFLNKPTCFKVLFSSCASAVILAVFFMLCHCPVDARNGDRLPGNALDPWGKKGSSNQGFSECVLVIQVTGLEPPVGILRLALYADRRSYQDRNNPVRSVATEIKSSNATIEFHGLPPGEYAVMMYHDANSNNRFDKLLGLPREQYGFSNNARPGFGPPDFEEVKFRVCAGKVTFLKIKAQL
ncbi:MAG: hypothetical protein DSZ23_03550 [Thermodesulfatator sp.]|nr:MAG: hypothetical protein DSZ23_03550 [Thermodesulfatator sp.]